MKYFFNYITETTNIVNKVCVLWQSTYVLDNHDKERKLDSKSLLVVDWAGDEVSGHIGSHDLKDRGLNISISESLDVTISHVSIPNLEWLGSKCNRVLVTRALTAMKRFTYPME